ncbi:unnamed protein product [Alopecurus aequalis]
MGRRKAAPNKPRGVKRKGQKKDNKSNGVDRNRASPSPVIKLCKKGLTDDQRAYVVKMGQGSFLDIKCEDLHSPLPDIGRAHELNMCKFVVDQLHESFSSGKFEKGCLMYCMLRYITDLNTDELVLNLEDSSYAINSWTTIARDCVTAWDTQEYDSTKLGVMQLRDEFKDVLSGEMGLFGGPDGFESWVQINIHPTSTIEQRNRAHSLMLSFASTVDGALSNLVQGLTESVPCERCAALDGIKASGSDRADKDDTVQENNDSGEDADGDESVSGNDEETETETELGQNAEAVAEQSHHGRKQAPLNEAGPSNSSPNSPMRWDEFYQLGSSQKTSSTDEAIVAAPLAWAPSHDESLGVAKGSTDEYFEEIKMYDELQAFVLGKTTEVSAEVKQEWYRHDERAKVFSARQRALLEKAKPGSTKDIRSLTPKVLLHKPRVKKGSRFKQSPYGVKLVVKQEHEHLYNLLLKHKSVRRKETTKLKRYRVIFYKNSWAYTQDLADSIFVRGELSNHCMEVGIEYLQRTNTIKVHSLSIMNQIHFPVLHEIAKNQKFGNHSYALCLNFEAERFEALGSLRGEGNMGLVSHATGIMNRIKQLWATYYQDFKIQIQNYDLKIIDVTKQHGNHDC